MICEKTRANKKITLKLYTFNGLSDSGERNGRKLTVLRRGAREMEKERNKNAKSKTTASFVEAVWK